MEAAFENRIRAVPEHSTAFMEAMSGGKAVEYDGFLFYVHDSWLIAVGYPLENEYEASVFENALKRAVKERRPEECWAIAPRLPSNYSVFLEEEDIYYILPADASIPARLRAPVKKAAAKLRIEEANEFTAGHRKLWAEFLRRKELKPQVRELFARTPFVLATSETDIRLLNAWDAEGNLAACLVIDYAPKEFSSYIIGAHSRRFYTPHAGDALFAAMLESARNENKSYIHLGLGVNEGIRRFKEKWGGVPTLPYQAASWKTQTQPGAKPGSGLRDAVMASLLAPREEEQSPPGNEFGNVLFGKRLPPEQRPYAMLWKLEKNGNTSWIGGTAHSFRYSFAASFRKLFSRVDTVIFEGPLDAASLAAFARHGHTGRNAGGDAPRIADYLTEKEIANLERIVCGPQGKFAHFCNMAWKNPVDVRRILSEYRPWSVFFSLYYAFLERHGWTQSVDLEAWEIAHDMGRNVIGMESIDEQIASLESVPLERIIRFLQHPENWKTRMRQSLSAYLAGDLENMLGTSTEFPTRTERVIGFRDERFRQRMRPYIELGRTAVFVGTAHMLNLENMLREDGFTVTKVLPTWKHKLRARKPSGLSGDGRP